MSDKVSPELRRHIVLIDAYGDITTMRNKLQGFDKVETVTKKLGEVLEEISKFENENPKDAFNIAFARILMKQK